MSYAVDLPLNPKLKIAIIKALLDDKIREYEDGVELELLQDLPTMTIQIDMIPFYIPRADGVDDDLWERAKTEIQDEDDGQDFIEEGEDVCHHAEGRPLRYPETRGSLNPI